MIFNLYLTWPSRIRYCPSANLRACHRRPVAAGVAVVSHIGLTPQSAAQLGGWRTQGRNASAALALLDDAVAVADAGCSAVVLECVPPQLARLISEAVTVPTIGIGAGPHTDAQVLVLHDILHFS